MSASRKAYLARYLLVTSCGINWRQSSFRMEGAVNCPSLALDFHIICGTSRCILQRWIRHNCIIVVVDRPYPFFMEPGRPAVNILCPIFVESEPYANIKYIRYHCASKQLSVSVSRRESYKTKNLVPEEIQLAWHLRRLPDISKIVWTFYSHH